MALEVATGKLTFKGGKDVGDLVKADYETLFGELASVRNTKVNVANELGINLVQNKLKSISDAVSNPSKFASDMATELKAIETLVNKEYQRVYTEYVVLGFPSSKAKDMAKNYAEAISKIELEKLNLKYPSDILNQALNSTAKVSTAKLGMIGL